MPCKGYGWLILVRDAPWKVPNQYKYAEKETPFNYSKNTLCTKPNTYMERLKFNYGF